MLKTPGPLLYIHWALLYDGTKEKREEDDFMYTCADCAVQVCRKADHEKMPKNCPIRNRELMDTAFAVYSEEAYRRFYVVSAEIESEGYAKWPRLKETIEFARRMGYQKLGLAFCAGLKEEAKTVAQLLRSHGFEVVSVICKAGSIPKERVGITEEQKVRPGTYEPMCNPVGQAMLLNEQGTEFNIALGLCVGHDSLFYRHSDALVTTLVAKDRAMGHNPCAAIYTANGYMRKLLEPQD